MAHQFELQNGYFTAVVQFNLINPAVCNRNLAAKSFDTFQFVSHFRDYLISMLNTQEESGRTHTHRSSGQISISSFLDKKTRACLFDMDRINW